MSAPARQRGLSLVELMVALTLGLVLTAGVVYLFMENKRTYRTADAVARLQENGRFALEMISYDLRMAGHAGCANRRGGAARVVASSIGALDFPATAVEALDQTGDGEPDTLAIRYASPQVVALDPDAPMADAQAEIALAGDVGAFEPGDVVVIADCSVADIFAVSGVDEEKGLIGHALNDPEGKAVNADAALSKRYLGEQGAGLMRFVQHRYEVKPSGRVNSGGDAIHALYRDGEELLEGVEAMHVQFGECMAGGNRRYRSWSQPPAHPENIASVRIGLLLHSIERVRDEADGTTYHVAGVDIAPAGSAGSGPKHAGDRRLRSVFSTTVALRNRAQEDCHG